jgi:hypothetical protein
VHSRLKELWPQITPEQRSRLKVLAADYFALKRELEDTPVTDDEPSRPSSLLPAVKEALR